MKIISNALEQIGGIEIYPIISLVIFFIVFGVTVYLVLTSDKSYIEEMKNMPLDDNSDLHSDSYQSNYKK